MSPAGKGRWEEADAINDPDVLWAVIEGLLARLAEIPDGQGGATDPIVYVLRGDPNHHRHSNCPLLVESVERQSKGSEQVRRTVRSGAVRAGLSECPACATHRPGRGVA